MSTFRDALAFVLLGVMVPALFLALTGTPGPLAIWVVLFILTTIKPRGPK